MTDCPNGGGRAWSKRLLAGLVFLGLGAALSGCQSIRYYKQAIRGEYQILAHREPIQKLISDSRISLELKAKFKLILRLREFAAKDLRLPVDGQYLRYVDLHRRYVVWNVHAAPEFSLEPKTWWYPFVGSLKYRGYFSESDARQYAEKLKRGGWEIYVEGVEAYSTLGWFKDPILNTFISEPEPDLAEILFHELAHQRVFISGDTDFNEAFATTVGEEGARRWLAAKSEADMDKLYVAALQRNEQFVQLIMAAREELNLLYRETSSTENPGAPQSHLRTKVEIARLKQKKEEVIAQLRAKYAELQDHWGGLGSYARWFAKPLNNAQLNTVAAYYDLVPGFRAMLRKDGGNLEKFYEEVRVLGKLKKAERRRRVAQQARSAPPVLSPGMGHGG